MRSIETHTAITIKKAIANHPEVAEGLRNNSSTLEGDIERFSVITGIGKTFIEQNLQQIRNWI